MQTFQFVRGQVGPLLRLARASLTRPADVMAYAPGDLIASPTTNYLGLELASNSGAPPLKGTITSVRLLTTNPDITDVRFRVMFWNSPGLIGVDNGPFSVSDWTAYFSLQGFLDLNVTQTDGTRSWGMENSKRLPFECANGPQGNGFLYAYLLSQKSPTYTPLNAQNFFLEIAAECDR